MPRVVHKYLFGCNAHNNNRVICKNPFHRTQVYSNDRISSDSNCTNQIERVSNIGSQPSAHDAARRLSIGNCELRRLQRGARFFFIWILHNRYP